MEEALTIVVETPDGVRATSGPFGRFPRGHFGSTAGALLRVRRVHRVQVLHVLRHHRRPAGNGSVFESKHVQKPKFKRMQDVR